MDVDLPAQFRVPRGTAPPVERPDDPAMLGLVDALLFEAAVRIGEARVAQTPIGYRFKTASPAYTTRV